MAGTTTTAKPVAGGGGGGGVPAKFLCKKVIDAAAGDKGVRCMIRVKDSMWGGARDGLSIEIRETKVKKKCEALHGRPRGRHGEDLSP